MPPKKDKIIDANEAAEMGEFLDAFAREIQETNKGLRIKAAQSSFGPYMHYDSASVKYDMDIHIVKEGVKKTRNVSIEAEIEGVSPPESVKFSPYAALYALFAPAEKDRSAIETELKKINPDIPSNRLPIFCVGLSSYWVPATGINPHYMVSLGVDQNRVEEIKTLDKLNGLIKPMLDFMSSKLALIYGD